MARPGSNPGTHLLCKPPPNEDNTPHTGDRLLVLNSAVNPVSSGHPLGMAYRLFNAG